jgi:hypothetical protein
MPKGDESLLLRCVECSELYAGSLTNDGDLVPDGAASGSRCHKCGNDEFEQITLPSSA